VRHCASCNSSHFGKPTACHPATYLRSATRSASSTPGLPAGAAPGLRLQRNLWKVDGDRFINDLLSLQNIRSIHPKRRINGRSKSSNLPASSMMEASRSTSSTSVCPLFWGPETKFSGILGVENLETALFVPNCVQSIKLKHRKDIPFNVLVLMFQLKNSVNMKYSMLSFVVNLF